MTAAIKELSDSKRVLSAHHQRAAPRREGIAAQKQIARVR
jgi:hypothetical protein